MKGCIMKILAKITVMCCVLMFAQIGFASDKIGVVDIRKIVENSQSVKTLRVEHNNRLEALNSIVKEAQNAIAKETDPQKIIILQDKYNNEFNTQKEMIDNMYKSKLQNIESNLKKDITESAKKHDYDYVFAKDVVFFGGDDITDIVSGEIK